ncbi:MULTISPECIES: hypothetical protein [Gordonia]|uniref:hypothetical protein n=1 Tax=Gordonia TaxID=2053 RepID=UPI00096884A9|nr:MULTISPECIES: hypothetical protein [Gordonia]MDH3005968.1 hypothetical protein [Gordonia alkanivorans]MDH3015723.1 hypothetical protein [Gordonia alkanivorans]MDH3040773.1 hypothetical protein [Gordonia alkanivorans]MDH3059173.1 hypothetical protein [Gordonia alkanivorans]OLT44323.1 hypothetical protein BJF87_06750 [Gordonia sp. CNJ-863]
MSIPTGPLAYVVALIAAFAIAFGVGRAWGPQPEPVTHDAPSHGVVETTVPDSSPRGDTTHTDTDHDDVTNGGDH